MKLVVGLGNPGNEYAMTRHNIGFMVVDTLLKKVDLGRERNDFSGVYYKGKIAGQDVIVLKPHTYMNNSGISVREVVDYFKINLEDILVINDDLDLNTATAVGITALKVLISISIPTFISGLESVFPRIPIFPLSITY